MTLLDPRVDPDISVGEPDVEALIREARRLRRRRWMFGGLLAVLALGAAVTGYVVGSGPPTGSHGTRSHSGSSNPGSSASSARAFTPTRSPDLIQPTTLAALPDGNVLILDSSRDQILELTPAGRVSVFAGDGRLGYAGDGGPARDAELDFTYFTSAGMAVTADGTVDVLDDGNCRIRAIGLDGVIRTITRVPTVKTYPHGTACPVDGMAISPAGSIYLTAGSAVERLSAGGRLVWVAGRQHGAGYVAPSHLTAANVLLSPDALAFDRAGDLYIANFSPKVMYKLTPAGKVTNLGWSYATQLAVTSNGEILAGTHEGVIQQVTPSKVGLFYRVVPKRAGIDWGRDQGFQEDGIAVTKNGTIYVDNAQGNGYGDGTVLVRISPTKRAALVPIRTPLRATLPKVGAAGFSASLYPAAQPSRRGALSSCPSDQGLERFTPQAVAQAKAIARTYLSSQFAAAISVTDRSWWAGAFNDFNGDGAFGSHTVTGDTPTAKSPLAAGIAQACGEGLVRESVAVTIGKSGYSDFAGTFYFLDRNGHPLVYDVDGPRRS